LANRRPRKETSSFTGRVAAIGNIAGMRRKLAGAPALLSLLLGAAVAGLWARSYWWWDVLNTRRAMFASRCGSLAVSYIEAASVDPTLAYLPSLRMIPTEPSIGGLWRFHHEVRTIFSGTAAAPVRTLVFPYWVPLVLAAVVPAWWWRSRRKRRAAGLCPFCGYDLRGSPGPTCPECGAAITKSS
jgi:hypothetical protein